MDIAGLANQLFVLFLIILLGYGLRRLGLLPGNTNQVLADLVVNVANPCRVLASVMDGQRTLTNSQVLLLTLVAVGMYGVLIALAHFVPRLLRVPREQAGTYRFMTVFSNISFIGFPIVAALFGDEAVFLAAIFVLVYQLFCYTYGIAQIGGAGCGRPSWRMLCSPMVLASLAAYVLYLCRIPVPGPVVQVADTVGEITSPAAMLSIGCAMAAVPLRRIFGNGKIYWFSACKLLLLPVVAWALCFWWMPNPLMLGVTVVVCAMPVATNATLLSTKYGGDVDLATAGVFVTTLLSLVTLPAVLALLF